MGRPRKNAAATTASEVNVANTNESTTTNLDEKVADRVKKQIKAATKAKGDKLTREELTQACLTDKSNIDENGIFMGEDYDKIKKKKNADEILHNMANMYKYDPVKGKAIYRVYFVDKLLAVAPGDPELHASHITKMSMDAMTRDEEIQVAGAQAVIDKGREHFEIINGKLVWSAHRWLAYIRDRANCISNVADSQSSEATNLKNNVLNRISFTRKYYPITLPAGGELSILDRPMPGDGYKRETSIKSSEAAPIGTTTYFVIQIENNIVSGNEKKKGSDGVPTKTVIAEALSNGITKGTGGWRGSGGYGKFLWEELAEDGTVIDGNTDVYLGCTSNSEGFKDAFYKFANNLTCADEDNAEIADFAL